MDNNLQKNLFSAINNIEDRLQKLEKRIDASDKALERSLQIIQTHLMLIKNGQTLADDMVMNRREYMDLAPEKAFRVYSDPDQDFTLLDVSKEEFAPEFHLPEALKIPLEELGARHFELPNKHAPLLIISEDGTRSILACELLNTQGYFNVGNISGGYRYWPADRMSKSA